MHAATRNRHLHVLSFLILVVAVMPTRAQAWETVTHEGHDYVTMESVRKFYGFDEMIAKNDWLTLESERVTCRFSLTGNEAVFNGIKFKLPFPVIKHQDHYLLSRITLAKILDPILRPPHITPKMENVFRTIILDPVPAEDPDHRNNLTLILANRLQDALSTATTNVILTREEEAPVPLAERLKIINSQDHALVISLQTSSDKEASGQRTLSLAPEGVAEFGQALKEDDLLAVAGNANDSLNIALATALHSRLIARGGRPDKGITFSRDPILAQSKHPAVILEIGNPGNPADAELFEQVRFHKSFVKVLKNALTIFEVTLQNSGR